jgi:hypothetical protein
MMCLRAKLDDSAIGAQYNQRAGVMMKFMIVVDRPHQITAVMKRAGG